MKMGFEGEKRRKAREREREGENERKSSRRPIPISRLQDKILGRRVSCDGV